MRKYWFCGAVAAYLAFACLLTLAAGCEVAMRDGGAVGVRITTGQIGMEVYHEAKLTSGNPMIRTDIERGLENWLGFWDSDGDGINDQSGPEPITEE